MFDITIPGYVWTCVCIMLFGREIRKWIGMFLDFAQFTITYEHECKVEQESKAVPESVKHMFS